MKQVCICKGDLLRKLEENREKHDKIYSEAVTGYWEQIQVNLDKISKVFPQKNRISIHKKY